MGTLGLGRHHVLPAVRADRLRRPGRTIEAATEHGVAGERAVGEAERAYLTRRRRATAHPAK
ncbi:hypothetical protein ABZ079_14960 [Streptomyces sp. NPDC006314]|uniref:hypothetical protein n=1 Tax=Streptomyces sp. NPDC006314 TaxID=3154475 RepID=UPI0033A87A7B